MSFIQYLMVVLIGLTNYFELFDNSMFHLAIENSLKFWLIALPLIILVPLLLAILFMNIPRFAAVFYKAVYTTMLLSSATLMTFVDLLFAKNGLLSEETAALFGLDASQLYQSRFAFPLLVLMYLYKYGGYNYLLYQDGVGTARSCGYWDDEYIRARAGKHRSHGGGDV